MEFSEKTKALLKACKPRERTFVRRLVMDPRRIQTRAYLAAGYRANNNVTARTCASQLLSRPRVRALYEAMLEEQYQHQGITDEDIINALSNIAFADPRELFDAEGKRKEIHELDAEVAAAVASVEFARESRRQVGGDAAEVVEESTVKVKLYDRIAALKTLAQVRGMLTNKHEHSGTINWEKIVAAASASAQEGQ